MKSLMFYLNLFIFMLSVFGCGVLVLVAGWQPLQAALPPRPTPIATLLATAIAFPTPTSLPTATSLPIATSGPIQPTAMATAVPTVQAAATATTEPTRIPVATLKLEINSEQEGLLSVVQWQDKWGNWYAVEGWRGAVNNGQTIWWVEAKDWGKSPYRWIVYRQRDGSIWGISESFVLPEQRGEVLVVQIAMAD